MKKSTRKKTARKKTASSMECHKFCVLFPQASEEVLKGMAADIAKNGLKEDIIRYEGKILDGRNRYLACKMAKVKPRYVEYDKKKNGDPLQYVISSNLHRRHLNEGQRAMTAHDFWEIAKKSKGAAKMTLTQVAKQFNVAPTTIKEAGVVKAGASEAMKKSVRGGTVKLNKISKATKKAMKQTGIIVTKKNTSSADKKKVEEKAEQIMKDEATLPKSTKTSRPKRVPIDGFDDKRFDENVAELKETLEAMNGFWSWYSKASKMAEDRAEGSEKLTEILGLAREFIAQGKKILAPNVNTSNPPDNSTSSSKNEDADSSPDDAGDNGESPKVDPKVCPPEFIGKRVSIHAVPFNNKNGCNWEHKYSAAEFRGKVFPACDIKELCTEIIQELWADNREDMIVANGRVNCGYQGIRKTPEKSPTPLGDENEYYLHTSGWYCYVLWYFQKLMEEMNLADELFVTYAG